MLDLLKLLSDACSTPDKYFLIVRPLPGKANRLLQYQFWHKVIYVYRLARMITGLYYIKLRKH